MTVPVGPGTVGLGPPKRTSERPAPPLIACGVGAGIALEKAGLPPSLLSTIKHLASLHNPVFYERQKLRLSTSRVPRFIKCYAEDVTHIHLPRGVLGDLTTAVKAVGSRLVVRDKRSRPARIPLTFDGELAPAQNEAVKQILAHDQGVLVAPPGTGKTVMGCYVVAARSVPTLVLVHRKPLLDQWRLQLISLLGLSAQEIGQFGAGKRKCAGRIDLGMIQSLRGVEALPEFLRRYGLIVVDECHHLPAFSFESCVKQAPVRYVLGLTATPYRRDGLQDIITMQCGPIRHSMVRRGAGAPGELILELVTRETGFRSEGVAEAHIQDVFRGIIRDEDRSVAICNDVLGALAHGGRCLILSERKEHCRVLAERLFADGKKPIILEGGQRRKVREAATEAIRSGPWRGARLEGTEGAPQSELLIIATGQYLGEGFDCPEIDTLFLAFPISFKGKLVQYVGRAMRISAGKSRVRIYDYADTQVPVLKRMYTKRLKTYQSLGVAQISEDDLFRAEPQRPIPSQPKGV